MINAKKEMQALLKGKIIKGAKIEYSTSDGVEVTLLKVNHTDSDYKRFLEDLNFDYDNMYGGQKLTGTVWLDNSWAERGEYDGAEWWDEYFRPEIPKELLS